MRTTNNINLLRFHHSIGAKQAHHASLLFWVKPRKFSLLTWLLKILPADLKDHSKPTDILHCRKHYFYLPP